MVHDLPSDHREMVHDHWTCATLRVMAEKVQDACKPWQEPEGEMHIRSLCHSYDGILRLPAHTEPLARAFC